MNETTKFIYENKIGKIIFSYDSLFWITEIDGASSTEIDISESKSISQVGVSITSQSTAPRTISIDGAIFEPLETTRKELIQIIAPQIPSVLTVLQNNEEWYLDVVPTKTPEISPGNEIQNFQFELFAAYPYWRTTALYQKQIAGLLGLFKFPFYSGQSWWVSKYTDSYFYTLNNKGNVPLEFTVVFSARRELKNPELYQVDTGKKIIIQKTLLAEEKIIVSTVYGERGVVFVDRLGVASNGFKYLDVESELDMTLLPGDNLLRIDAVANREGLAVHIKAPEGVRSGV